MQNYFAADVKSRLQPALAQANMAATAREARHYEGKRYGSLLQRHASVKTSKSRVAKKQKALRKSVAAPRQCQNA
jgi:hypothetical protein